MKWTFGPLVFQCLGMAKGIVDIVQPFFPWGATWQMVLGKRYVYCMKASFQVPKNQVEKKTLRKTNPSKKMVGFGSPICFLYGILLAFIWGVKKTPPHNSHYITLKVIENDVGFDVFCCCFCQRGLGSKWHWPGKEWARLRVFGIGSQRKRQGCPIGTEGWAESWWTDQMGYFTYL